MPTLQLLPTLRQWINKYPYGSAVLSTLALVTLLVGTNGFAGVRRAIHTVQQRIEDRQLAREAGRYVWCFSRYTDNAGKSVIYGYWPGYHKQDILRAYDTPTWLLSLRQQNKECYRNWQRAAEATDEIATSHPSVLINSWQMPDSGSRQEVYRQAVLMAVLDPPIASYHQGKATAEQAARDRWCMSRLHNAAYTLYYVPHTVGGRDAVEPVLDKLSDRSHLDHYRIEETACFVSDADAIDWLKKSGFVPPENTTIAAYVETVTAWVGEG